MLMIGFLVQLTLWVAAAHAFFPWIPSYSCPGDGTSCQGQARRWETADGFVTLPLAQRARDSSESKSERVSRAARHFSRKFDRSGRLPSRQYNRYNVVKAADPAIADSAGVHQDGTDFSYFLDVGLGSGPKSVYMLFDTGAGSTWVMGSSCKTSACAVHNSFGPGDSKTFQASTKAFSILYGSGEVSGALATDLIAFAGKKVTLSFGIANVTSDDFNHFPFDGILGMSLSMGATDNVMQVFKRERLLRSNVFGVMLSRRADGPNVGEVSFGGANPAKYTGSITYAAVSDRAGGDWAIALDDFAYDGRKAGISGRLAYIDTGTTFIFGPPSDLALIHKQIPGARSADGITYTAPCDSTRPLTVSFAGVSYTIQSRDWLSAPSATGECTSNLYGHEVVKDAWLLGDAFLKNVYAVFDIDQTRIGFANRLAVVAPPSATPTTAVVTGPNGATSPAGSSTASSPGAAATPQPGSSGTATGPRQGLGGHETSTIDAPTAASTTPASQADRFDPHGRAFVTVVCFVVASLIMA